MWSLIPCGPGWWPTLPSGAGAVRGAHLCGRDDCLVNAAALLPMVAGWRTFLAGSRDEQGLREVRGNGRTGRPLGSDSFVARLETMVGRPLAARRPGRRAILRKLPKRVLCLELPRLPSSRRKHNRLWERPRPLIQRPLIQRLSRRFSSASAGWTAIAASQATRFAGAANSLGSTDTGTKSSTLGHSADRFSATFNPCVVGSTRRADQRSTLNVWVPQREPNLFQVFLQCGWQPCRGRRRHCRLVQERHGLSPLAAAATRIEPRTPGAAAWLLRPSCGRECNTIVGRRAIVPHSARRGRHGAVERVVC